MNIPQRQSFCGSRKNTNLRAIPGSLTETFLEYIETYSDYVWLPTNSTNPTLHEIRGKIVIIQDFDGGRYGPHWDDLFIQDEFKVASQAHLYDKWQHIKDHFKEAENSRRSAIYVNFLSGTGYLDDSGPIPLPAYGGTFPFFIASGHIDYPTNAPRVETVIIDPPFNDWKDFPRTSCWDVKFEKFCFVSLEGTNVLTMKYLRSTSPFKDTPPTTRAGIVFADFPGSGLISAIIDINPYNQSPAADAGGPYVTDEGTAITFDASGSWDPDNDILSYRWDFDNDGTWDTEWSEEPTATFTWYDDWEGRVKVQVRDDQERDTDTARVTVNNVPPTVTVDDVMDGDPFVLTYLDANLEASFTDPGTLDTHVALIEWEDGDPAETLIDPAVSPLADTRIYTSSGIYCITVTVEDDDGGVGDASTTIEVKTPIEATIAAIEGLKAMDDNEFIEDALNDLEGNNNGRGGNGALDMLERGNYAVALMQFGRALEDLAAAEESDPSLDLSYTRRLLSLIGRATATELIALSTEAGTTSAEKIAEAEALLTEGVALEGAGSYLGAVVKYEEAVRALTGNTPDLSGAAGGGLNVGVILAIGVGVMLVAGIMAWRSNRSTA